jgi:hypothetical protein
MYWTRSIAPLGRAIGVALLFVGPPLWAAPRLPPRPADGLHTDVAIRALAGPDDPQPAPDGAWDYLKLPCLDVVPSGQSRPRADVFKDLGLDEGRTRDRRDIPIDNVVFLAWQVSPSYDLVYMTATNDPANDMLDPFDPSRKVYGVRIVLRSSQRKR